MKLIKVVSTVLFCFLAAQVLKAQSDQCAHCNMDIRDDSFRAKAETNSDKTLHFDAIECLVNYLKTKDQGTFQKLLVTDYQNGQFIGVTKAYYLKSESVPSPMGANLSAYLTESAAKAERKEKGGDIFTWAVLNARFSSSNFGATEHSHHHHDRPDTYAPSGIMGDHLHPKGGFMLSVNYMNMAMGGNRKGDETISDGEIYEQYMIAPQNMNMQMFMLGAMYATSDNLTLMLMQNFLKKDMDLTARMMDNGMPMYNDFSTTSTDLGDMKIGVLYGLFTGDRNSFHLNTGINIPTGDIENHDATPMMDNAKLPYAMQLGSGTFDFSIGATYRTTFNNLSLGVQQYNTIRTGTNKGDYRLGNRYELHTWLAYAFTGRLSASARVSGSTEGDIKGNDPELNPMMVPTANAGNYGGELVRAFVGLNSLLAQNDLVLGVEIGTPLYQNYSGILMDEDLTVNASLKYTLF